MVEIKYDLIKIDSWEQFENKLGILFTPPVQRAWVFRGQSDFMHTLRPSLQRIFSANKIDRETAIKMETEATYQFKVHAPLYIDSYLSSVCQSDLDWWGLMQHYGAPTRFLDWTYSPYVAAYFACENSLEIDGAIWVFNHVAVREYLIKKGHSSYDDGFGMTRLCQNKNATKTFMSVETNIKTKRMAAQQGLFTISANPLSDHAIDIHEIMESVNAKMMFLKLLIKREIKLEFMQRLQYMNISAHTLFPGIEGLGKSIREHFSLTINSIDQTKKLWKENGNRA